MMRRLRTQEDKRWHGYELDMALSLSLFFLTNASCRFVHHYSALPLGARHTLRLVISQASQSIHIDQGKRPRLQKTMKQLMKHNELHNVDILLLDQTTTLFRRRDYSQHPSRFQFQTLAAGDACGGLVEQRK